MTSTEGSEEPADKSTWLDMEQVDLHDKRFVEEHPEIVKKLRGESPLSVVAFGRWLRSVWVADLVSESVPAMAELALGGVA